jgi:hypothetical protein
MRVEDRVSAAATSTTTLSSAVAEPTISQRELRNSIGEILRPAEAGVAVRA